MHLVQFYNAPVKPALKWHMVASGVFDRVVNMNKTMKKVKISRCSIHLILSWEMKKIFQTFYFLFSTCHSQKRMQAYETTGLELETYGWTSIKSVNACGNESSIVLFCEKFIFWIFERKNDCMNVCSRCNDTKLKQILKDYIFRYWNGHIAASNINSWRSIVRTANFPVTKSQVPFKILSFCRSSNQFFKL